MSLITEPYRALNRAMHENVPEYGTSSARHASVIRKIANMYSCASILDYGCGKGLLAKTLEDGRIQEYDPAIPGKDSPPVDADLVVCTDVMEHIEPECVSSVLEHIQALALKTVYFAISTIPARKILPDGRNAHINLKPADWWLLELIKYFSVVEYSAMDPGNVIALGRRRPHE